MANENDVTEMWREVRADRQVKRADNRASSRELLRAAGVPFIERNDGVHLIVVRADGRRADFWPGTGLWIIHGRAQRQRGVKNLLRWLGKHGGPALENA